MRQDTLVTLPVGTSNQPAYLAIVPTTKLVPPNPTITFANWSHNAAMHIGWSKLLAG
jgi:hypothetical protein